MKVRISHCSTSLENFYTCLNEKVSGFNNRGPQPDDLIYLVVKVGKKSLCGARFILDEATDYKPWINAENYVNTLTIRAKANPKSHPHFHPSEPPAENSV